MLQLVPFYFINQITFIYAIIAIATLALITCLVYLAYKSSYITCKCALFFENILFNLPFYYMYIYCLYLAIIFILAVSEINSSEGGLLFSNLDQASSNASTPGLTDGSSQYPESIPTPSPSSAGSPNDENNTMIPPRPSTPEIQRMCNETHSDQVIHDNICGKSFREIGS